MVFIFFILIFFEGINIDNGYRWTFFIFRVNKL